MRQGIALNGLVPFIPFRHKLVCPHFAKSSMPYLVIGGDKLEKGHT
jgi:hypothetical protein